MGLRVGVRGFFVPGLAMAASELPSVEGVIALENPEVGKGIALGREYTLEEVAEQHVCTIEREAPRADALTLAGMSMGGMIVAIMATRFRARLPARCAFRFFVTTPNTPENPAIPDALIAEWATARRGVVLDFERVLGPFFSPAFVRSNPTAAQAYFAYRANGGNRQSGSSFFRQMNALRGCPAYRYFSQLDPREAKFVGGADDRILGPSHNRELLSLCPGAEHTEIESLGHMVNIERSDLMRSPFDVAP